MPVTLLDFSVEVQNSIYMIYNEFLRAINLDLQIYISNRKMNTANYIENIKENILKQGSEKFKNFLNSYLIDIEEKLDNEKIYITKYYIIITMDYKSENVIEEIDNTFLKLNKLGCIVNRIKEKQYIKDILYESINKESLK